MKKPVIPKELLAICVLHRLSMACEDTQKKDAKRHPSHTMSSFCLPSTRMPSAFQICETSCDRGRAMVYNGMEIEYFCFCEWLKEEAEMAERRGRASNAESFPQHCPSHLMLERKFGASVYLTINELCFITFFQF